MPIRKKGDVEIKTSPKGAQVKQTGYTFYSYDKNSAALYFNFREENGEPTDLANATIRLVFVLNDEKITPKTDDIEIWLAVPGTARYIIPESMLGREGKVTGYVYLEFSDGSHTDEGRFTFEIKQSMITDMLPEAGEQYVKDFEDIKAEVQEAADGAKETINQKVTEISDTSDSAISKVNQVADDTIKTASEAKSDVQSKADEASYSIDEAVKSTESARDEAIETMTELDYSNRNLLTGTSSEWEEFSFSGFTSGFMTYSLDQLGLKVGDTLTYAAEIDNTKDESNLLPLSILANFYGEEGKLISRIKGNQIKSNEKGMSIGTREIPEGTIKIQAYKVRKTETNDRKKAAARKHKLQKGNYATYWTPNPSEIVTQDQYNKLVNAITNLGGSV
ncbi:BppU family phage baseplate upper protein [Tetragenococcus halophilus]|uniref:BppU family phage baseplate upper protein n=1 Tax=Tetragenococcus halophilus TaxID=51669 RepID=A0AB35HQ73_TETHA|nr:BppU family phage baseplate upper protein [Tetragenococcus halophilus]